MASGFQLTRRALQFMVPLGPLPTSAEERFSRSKRYDVRAARKKGLQPRQAPADELGTFCALLRQTYERFAAEATHRPEELEEIFRRVPDRVRLYLCDHAGEVVAGVLVFLLNDVIASTFYICESDAGRKVCAAACLLAYIMERTTEDGRRYLDLGPSATESS